MSDETDEYTVCAGRKKRGAPPGPRGPQQPRETPLELEVIADVLGCWIRTNRPEQWRGLSKLPKESRREFLNRVALYVLDQASALVGAQDTQES